MRHFGRSSQASWTLLLVLAAIAPASAQIIETPETKIIPRLAVRGEAELRKPADLLLITVGVLTEDSDAAKALAENTRRMTSVHAALKGTGLDEGELETSRFQIRPKYSRRPRQADPEWAPQVIGYEVSNEVQVRTGRLELAGRLIQTANEAGANSIDDIQFDLQDRRRYRAEAIAEATKHAREDARDLAAAAGVRLLRLLSIDLDPESRVSTLGRGRALAEGASVPISPGDVTINATVSLVYEIGDGEDETDQGEQERD